MPVKMSVVARVWGPPLRNTGKSIPGWDGESFPTSRRQGGVVALESHRVDAGLVSPAEV